MSLLTNLISYWKMDEASGNALDAHGANDLTDNNTVGSATGIIGNARDFEADNSEFFNIADNADLSVDNTSNGDIGFTIQAWVKLESQPGTLPIVGKFDDNFSPGREYLLYWNSGTNRFTFGVTFDGGEGFQQVSADTFGNISTGVWYLIHAWYDPLDSRLHICVNAGLDDSGLFVSTNVIDPPTAAPFTIGSYDSTTYFDGLIDEVGFWKRVLTSQERTDLYNSGAGLAYPFTPAAPITIRPTIGLGRRMRARRTSWAM